MTQKQKEHREAIACGLKQLGVRHLKRIVNHDGQMLTDGSVWNGMPSGGVG